MPAESFPAGERAQTANEENELPAIVVHHLMRIAPRRHSGKLNAVFDDVMEVAIGEVLGGRRTQIGNPRIKARSGLSDAAAIVTVTNGAAGDEVVSPVLNQFCRIFSGFVSFRSREGIA